MLTYKFWISYKWTENERPYMIIEEYEETLWSDEINQLSWEYIKEIVQELEEVVAWTRDKCVFWFETTLIWCYKKGYKSPNWNIYPNWKVAITYDYWDKELATDLKAEDILKMMKDWRDYIESWEKKTGKKYNGI